MSQNSCLWATGQCCFASTRSSSSAPSHRQVRFRHHLTFTTAVSFFFSVWVAELFEENSGYWATGSGSSGLTVVMVRLQNLGVGSPPSLVLVGIAFITECDTFCPLQIVRVQIRRCWQGSHFCSPLILLPVCSFTEGDTFCALQLCSRCPEVVPEPPGSASTPYSERHEVCTVIPRHHLLAYSAHFTRRRCPHSIPSLYVPRADGTSVHGLLLEMSCRVMAS